MALSLLTLSLLPVSMLCASLAQAAEVTSIPPFLRGDLEVQYTFTHEGGSLLEEDIEVATRRIETHDIVYAAAFAAGPGVAVFMELPQNAATRVSFPTANEMVYDPSQRSGTMIETDPIVDTPAVSGSGLGGVWMGIRGTPFSESFKRRGNLATWLIEGAYQTADSSSFWHVADGARGGGPGGSAWRIRNAFSTTHRFSNPYLDFRYTKRNPFQADLTEIDGTVLASGVELDPSNEIRVFGGTELTTYENKVSQARFAIDLRLGFSYQSWQTIQSGVLLPSIISSSAAIPVTESEYETYTAGLGFIYKTFQYLQLNLRGDVAYITPHRVEHPYPIQTGADTLAFGINFGMKVFVRSNDAAKATQTQPPSPVKTGYPGT